VRTDIGAGTAEGDEAQLRLDAFIPTPPSVDV
jgi:hypothetical protein